jgi:hypothetical protein
MRRILKHDLANGLWLGVKITDEETKFSSFFVWQKQQ